MCHAAAHFRHSDQEVMLSLHRIDAQKKWSWKVLDSTPPSSTFLRSLRIHTESDGIIRTWELTGTGFKFFSSVIRSQQRVCGTYVRSLGGVREKDC